MIGCARERRRDEGRPDDDLRARPDCFNRQIWLDESASEWGRRKRILQLSKLQVAGGVDEGRGKGPTSFRGCRCRKVPTARMFHGAVNFGRCDACLPHNPTRLTPDA